MNLVQLILLFFEKRSVISKIKQIKNAIENKQILNSSICVVYTILKLEINYSNYLSIQHLPLPP